VAYSCNKLPLRIRLRNLNLKSQFSIFDSFRDIHVHTYDLLKFVGGLWALGWARPSPPPLQVPLATSTPPSAAVTARPRPRMPACCGSRELPAPPSAPQSSLPPAPGGPYPRAACGCSVSRSSSGCAVGRSGCGRAGLHEGVATVLLRRYPGPRSHTTLFAVFSLPS